MNAEVIDEIEIIGHRIAHKREGALAGQNISRTSKHSGPRAMHSLERSDSRFESTTLRCANPMSFASLSPVPSLAVRTGYFCLELDYNPGLKRPSLPGRAPKFHNGARADLWSRREEGAQS